MKTIEFRHQNDGLQDEASAAASIDFTGTDSLVRAEFKEESDINNILTRYGVNPQNLRQMTYGAEVDERLDLQTALFAIEQAKSITGYVPDELRSKYNDWRAILNGAESGEYQYDLDQLEKRKAEEKLRKETEEKDAAELAERRQRDTKAPVTV